LTKHGQAPEAQARYRRAVQINAVPIAATRPSSRDWSCDTRSFAAALLKQRNRSSNLLKSYQATTAAATTR
jgi:hypothetical protein